MPLPRFEKLPAEKQRVILETAAEEFADRGYDGASLNRLIEGLGLSKGAFYYYFDGKADLFSAVVELLWKELSDVDIDLTKLTATSFWTALDGWFKETRNRIHDKPWLVGVSRLFYHPPDDARVRRLVESKFAEWRIWHEALIRQGQEVGAIRTDLPSPLLISMMVALDTAADHWMLDHWDELSPEESDRLADLLIQMHRRLLEPPPKEDS